MAILSPWSVKGVAPEAREAGKIAARRAGLPMGVWLSQIILSAAAIELKAPPRAATSASERDGSDAADAASGAARPQPPALLPAQIMDAIRKLSLRIEESETKTAQALTPIAQKVVDLARQVEEMKSKPPPSAAPVSTGAVERAISRLAERLEQVEQGRSARQSGAVEQPAAGASRGFFGRMLRD